MYKVYGTNTKKMLNMLILEILETYSDEDHPLTQKDIIELLKSEYGEKCDRRSVKANIESLKNMGYDIFVEDGQPYYLMSRDLENDELRWLIDAVLFSKALPGNQAKELIEKLEGFGNKYFESKVSHVSRALDVPRTKNTMVLHNVDSINDAIDQKKKITFHYNAYGTDFKLHDKGKVYKVNPYQMVVTNGYYYLLSNMDDFNNVTYFRIDKMSKVMILDEKIKPMKTVKGLENGLDIPKHMAEHIYMFNGESVSVKLKCDMAMTDALVDWFGKEVLLLEKNEKDNYITVKVRCNQKAMFYWALQYGPSVEVLEPKDLRDDVKKAIQNMAKKYKG